MTLGKFKRLFIVLLIPLLLFGYLSTLLIFPYEKYAYITCAPFFGIENCREVGDPDSSLHKSVKSEYPRWFEVNIGKYDGEAFLQNVIQASGRAFGNALVVSAFPFNGSPASAALAMQSLAGQSAIVHLGTDSTTKSAVLNSELNLFCNNLNFTGVPGEYVSNCYGENWGGPVTYRLSGNEQKQLDKLQSSINEEVDKRQSDYNLYRVITYPIFVVIFLMVSFFIWLFARAIKFVKNG